MAHKDDLPKPVRYVIRTAYVLVLCGAAAVLGWLSIALTRILIENLPPFPGLE